MTDSASSSIAVIASEPGLQEAAAALAARLNLPFLQGATANTLYPLLLIVTPQHLELRQASSDAPGAVYVHWHSGRLAYRQRHSHIKHEAIARAVGLKKGVRPDVVDATAGLGRDGFMLATLGCRVRLLERSPIIAALLQDAFTRANNDPELGQWLQQRLALLCVDSVAYLQQLPAEQRPDVVCLDPMYPQRQKSALVKKELRLLRTIVGDDSDADQLLSAALLAAKQRVVVKRPRIAPTLVGPKPDFTMTGTSTRFDVYLSSHRR